MTGKNQKIERKHKAIADWMKHCYKTFQQAATKYKLSMKTIQTIAIKHDVPFPHEMAKLRDEAIINYMEQDHGYKEAAEYFEVSISTVTQAMRRGKFSPVYKQSDRVYSIIADLQNTGFTQVEIAARKAVSRQTICNILTKGRKNGIKFPGRDK